MGVKEAMQRGINFSLEEIMADFELTLVQSLELQFLGALGATSTLLSACEGRCKALDW